MQNQQTAQNIDFAGAIIQQATIQVQSGDIPGGLNSFHLALQHAPSSIAALSGCGVAESLNGNHKTAIDYFRKALMQNPHETQILVNLGHAHIALGEGLEALGAFKHAVQLNPQDSESAYWVGYLSEQNNDTKQAERFYRKAIRLNPNHRQCALQLSNLLYNKDQKAEAFQILRSLEAKNPDDKDVTFLRGQLLKKSVPGWHLSMLDDTPRNDAYDAAIRAKITEGDIVLDIGTGSGILAMMAARAGAGHVYACEMDPILADLAQEVIAKNGYSDKITLIKKKSNDMVIGVDMPVKADMLVSEILDSAVVGEDILPSYHDAQQRLLNENAKMVPEKASLKGALLSCPHFHRHDTLNEVSGFDLSPMQALATPYAHKDAMTFLETDHEGEIISETFTLHDFNFEAPTALGFSSEVSTKITKDGKADSVLMWFDLELAPSITYTTEGSCSQHWRPAAQIIRDPAAAQKGDTLTLATKYDAYFDFSVESK